MRALALAIALAAAAAHARGEPCADRDPLRRPYFGDVHVHTRLSFDAWGQGTRAGPRDAYRFARGEEIGIQPWDASGRALARVRLRRPLDFAAVTDHSELLGENRMCQTPGSPGWGSLVCRVVRRWPGLGYVLVNGHVYASVRPRRYSFCGPDGALCREAARGPWREILEAAEAFQDRSPACTFTTFPGYEWTGMPGGNNIHRNVIFRSGVVQDLPTTYIETPTAEGLRAALLAECIEGREGCDALAIPHNSNLSGGLMFTTTRSDGSPITARDAALRARLETLVEVTQHKGDSECRVSAEDELCSFETLTFARMQEMVSPPEEPDVPPLSYAREALRAGLVQERRLGVNPFRFGLIGSTDTHFGTPGAVDEDEHRGHAAGSVSARFGIPPYPDLPFFNPGGLAVLWAEENSRDALFLAMRRREAYGTSGPRMVVRFFGGEYGAGLCEDPDFARKGYRGGVPMGGVLPPTAAAPRFAVWAERDAGGGGVPTTPLQRIQIVKGWVGGDGASHERVFDVAGDSEGAASVDLRTCAPRGPGFDRLCAVWRDPDFDPASQAFWYARVVENPSCRWNQWVCNRAGVDCAAGRVKAGMEACCDERVPKTIQERAWTSPIWYAPG